MFMGWDTRSDATNHAQTMAAFLVTFLNVPSISVLEWHPFTIASAPHDSKSTFHIRDMGPGSFTGRLHALAAAKFSGAARRPTGPGDCQR